MYDYVLVFSSPNPSLSLVGGKGKNLIELVQANFPVPEGFIITTDAYHAFVEANHIQTQIFTFLKASKPDDMSLLESISAQIRSLFESGTMPKDIEAEIASAYSELRRKTGAVAVRSSATAEDLPGLAFAGQQDTYLNVIGDEALMKAVKHCWGSLWTVRAITYRERNQIVSDTVALAVVVQTMIASEVSGVLFTANPLTGRRDEMVIDASFGLGEAIVSGQVEPDHYVIRSQDWRITERKLGAKALAIIPRVEGGTETISKNLSSTQVLEDSQIIELAKMAQRVSDTFASPQDIEWAWANQQFYLLQARPITSLYPLPRGIADADFHIYVNFNAIQGVSDPITPLGIDLLRLMAGGVAKVLGIEQPMNEIMPEAGNRLFIDFTTIMQDPRLRNIGLSILEGGEPGARQTLLRLIESGTISTKPILSTRRIIRLILSGLPILSRVFAAVLRPDRVRQGAIADAELYITEAQAHIEQARNLADCLKAIEADLPHSDRISIRIMPSVVPIISAAPPLVDGWLRNWLDEAPGAALQLMRGLPGNVTIEMNLKLWDAAQRIRADSETLDAIQQQSFESLVQDYRQKKLPPIAQQALEAFLEIYGMRGMAEIDAGHAKWRDDPTPIIQTLLGYLDLKDTQLAPDIVYARGAEQAERLAQAYIARSRKLPFGWLRARLLDAVIHRMRTLGGLREIPLFYIARLFGIYRTALLGYGHALMEAHQLEQADDIFFIPLEDLKRFAAGKVVDLQSIVTTNRITFDYELNRRQMPRVLLSTGEAFYEGAGELTDSGPKLTGDAVSPGIAEGRARVIFNPYNVRLEPGEILVCPSTDPGWTPLFLTAGGLVMEIGGMVTHGSIVAREYGIPAVVGVHQATKRIQSGQRLRVDGSRGQVTIIEE
jgi:rifampicin phosphotransferase